MAQKYRTVDGVVNVAIVINPYNGDRAGDEQDIDARAMVNRGLVDTLTSHGIDVQHVNTVRLTSEDDNQYGRWNRFGLASGHLADFVANNEKTGLFNIGFFNNCNSLLGMLGGLQHAGAGGQSLRVGLLWIDAHADYNTPETTLSGMLGGMPVAITAGHALERMRLQSKLNTPLPTEHIVMVGVRDTDPLEQERLDNSFIEHISVADIRSLSGVIGQQIERLSQITDLIYVHIDLDVLAPDEVSGHPLTVSGGPTSRELAAALKVMFEYEKTAALGIASYPADADPDEKTLHAVYRLVLGAVKGVQSRRIE